MTDPEVFTDYRLIDDFDIDDLVGFLGTDAIINSFIWRGRRYVLTDAEASDGDVELSDGRRFKQSN